MTLRDHLRVLKRRRWVLIAVVGVCAVAATAYALFGTPVYEAQAELVMASDADPRSAVLSAAAPVLSMLGEPVSALGGNDLATQVQIIDSRPSLEGAWGLMHDRPEVLDRLLRMGLTDELLEELPGIVEGLPRQPPPAQWPDPWEDMLETLVVAPVEESEVIEVRCEAPDPQRARDFVNALVLAYLGRSLADARATTRRARTYVDDQLADVEARLAESEERLRRFGERIGTVALDETARQQVELLVSLNEQAAVARSRLNARRALRDELEAKLADLDERVNAPTVTRRNPEIAQLQSELATAEAERVSLLEEYAADSMPVRRAAARVEELRARLRSTAVEVVDSRQEAINPVTQEIMQQMLVAEGEQMAAEHAARVLEAAASRVEEELAGLPDEQVALLKLEREIELLERFYLALKEKQQEYEISERAKTPAARLVTHAIRPDEPARPKQALAVVAGVAAGTLLGLLAVGLAEQLDDRLHDGRQAAEALGLPLLGVLAEQSEGDGPQRAEALRAILAHVRGVGAVNGLPDICVMASCNTPHPAREVAEDLQHATEAPSVVVGPGDAGERADESGLSVLLAPTTEPGVVEALLESIEAELVIAVPPSDSGVMAASPLLAAGGRVVVLVRMGETNAEDARAVVKLVQQRGTEPLGLIAVGGRHSSGRYYTPET